MRDTVQRILDDTLAACGATCGAARGIEHGALRVLEAGCGSVSRLRFPDGTRITGIDIAPEQLERNTILQEKILVDLQIWQPGERRFDAVVCWDVLEHLREPLRAMEHCADAVDVGGVLILGLPHVLSLKGLLTKCTPHALHVWVYRHLLGDALAGREGRAPFPAYHRFALRPRALRRHVERSGLRVEALLPYRHDFMEWTIGKRPLLRVAWTALAGAVRLLSLGRIDVHNTDVLLIARR